MALNTSGPISIAGTTVGQSIQIELNGNGTTQMSLNDAAVRTLAEVPSGQIAMPTNFYGKANTFLFNISSDQQQANLATLALAAGWNGTAPVIVTITAGVYVSSNSTSTPALTVDGSWPGGVTIVNNGFIIGKGGAGGAVSVAGGNGNAGGTALSILTPVTITNNSYIAGGGGGGAGTANVSQAAGGGGAGSGAGGQGTGGAAGGSGGNILPGTGGAAITNGNGSGAYSGNSGGSGGSGSLGFAVIFQPPVPYGLLRGTAGGGGGGWGASGGLAQSKTSDAAYTMTSGAGGSAGNIGGNASGGTNFGAVPGTGGKAVALNGYSVTWSVLGTIYGAVS